MFDKFRAIPSKEDFVPLTNIPLKIILSIPRKYVDFGGDFVRETLYSRFRNVGARKQAFVRYSSEFIRRAEWWPYREGRNLAREDSHAQGTRSETLQTLRRLVLDLPYSIPFALALSFNHFPPAFGWSSRVRRRLRFTRVVFIVLSNSHLSLALRNFLFIIL